MAISIHAAFTNPSVKNMTPDPFTSFSINFKTNANASKRPITPNHHSEISVSQKFEFSNIRVADFAMQGTVASRN
jgi:hypothetical protein